MSDSPLAHSLDSLQSEEMRLAADNASMRASMKAAYRALDTSTPQVKKSQSVQSALAILADAAGIEIIKLTKKKK